MQTLHTFQVIATQTLLALIAVWPLSALVFAVAAVALVSGTRVTVPSPRSRRILIFAIFILPAIAILIGALLAYNAPQGSTYEHPSAWKGFVLWLPIHEAF